MIKVKIKKDKNSHIIEYRVYGHAGFDEYGKDIVCSAVSALTQAVVIGLKEVAGIEIDYSVNGDALRCSLPPLEDYKRREADILLNTMCLALDNIKSSYPSNLTVIEEEV
ncbi:MAG: putative ribosomal protein [Firmicutes bacterium]|nr:putative ribosomal protein [Bacillota bacterium]MDI6706533.1 ribosomal-processing cysteine protease Prp [Bacillota bacterium]